MSDRRIETPCAPGNMATTLSIDAASRGEIWSVRSGVVSSWSRPVDESGTRLGDPASAGKARETTSGPAGAIQCCTMPDCWSHHRR